MIVGWFRIIADHLGIVLNYVGIILFLVGVTLDLCFVNIYGVSTQLKRNRHLFLMFFLLTETPLYIAVS